jgi:hypothetical protein
MKNMKLMKESYWVCFMSFMHFMVNALFRFAVVL